MIRGRRQIRVRILLLKGQILRPRIAGRHIFLGTQCVLPARKTSAAIGGWGRTVNLLCFTLHRLEKLPQALFLGDLLFAACPPS